MRVQCTCRQCGGTFTKFPSQVALGRGAYCSRMCRHDALGRGVACECHQCGRSFRRPPSQIENGRGMYCGRRCKDLGRLIPLGLRFWSKVNRDGPIPSHAPHLGACWTWTGAKAGKSGYGETTTRGKKALTHRLSYALANGPIPPRMVVCHRCDNPPCVRPDHLFLGTHADNVADMVAKGRQRPGRGTAKRAAKLNDDAVREIRRQWDDGETQWAIARRFGVHHGTINSVVHGRTWRHVE